MRKVGIEMEFKGDREQVNNALAEAGLTRQGAGVMSYSHRDAEFWATKTDSSVGNGGEVVSPPLNFYDLADRRQLTVAIRAMREGGGAKPSHKAGFHIHVERDGLSKHEIGLICKFGVMFEDVLFRQAMGTFRVPRAGWTQYCHPYGKEAKKAMLDTDFDFDTCYAHSPKYNFINLQTRNQATVEFRLFNSTMNAKLVQANVALCANLVHVVRLGKFKRALNRETVIPLGSMKEGWRDPDESFKQMLRILRCGGDGISPKDEALLKEFWYMPPLPDAQGHRYALPEWVNASSIHKTKHSKRVTFADLIEGDDPDDESPGSSELADSPPGRDSRGRCVNCSSDDYCYCCHNCGQPESSCDDACVGYEAVGSR